MRWPWRKVANPWTWSHELAVHLPRTPDGADVFGFLDDWCTALVAGDYRRALEMTHPPRHRVQGDTLGPDWLKSRAMHYGRFSLPSTACYRDPSRSRWRSLRPTPEEELEGGRHQLHPERPWLVVWWPEPDALGDVGCVDAFLPVEGWWSNVVARFQIVPEGDSVALELVDIVMP